MDLARNGHAMESWCDKVEGSPLIDIDAKIVIHPAHAKSLLGYT
jgi:hypothetical protein